MLVKVLATYTRYTETRRCFPMFWLLHRALFRRCSFQTAFAVMTIFCDTGVAKNQQRNRIVVERTGTRTPKTLVTDASDLPNEQ